jgi:hypothetical protein
LRLWWTADYWIVSNCLQPCTIQFIQMSKLMEKDGQYNSTLPLKSRLHQTLDVGSIKPTIIFINSVLAGSSAWDLLALITYWIACTSQFQTSVWTVWWVFLGHFVISSCDDSIDLVCSLSSCKPPCIYFIYVQTQHSPARHFRVNITSSGDNSPRHSRKKWLG